MAHLIEQMAYVGQIPWHGLGNELTSNQPLDVWAKQAGLDWQIQESPVRFVTNAGSPLGEILSYPDSKVLYRSDTKAPLSVVGNRFKVVQPEEILEFYVSANKPAPTFQLTDCTHSEIVNRVVQVSGFKQHIY